MSLVHGMPQQAPVGYCSDSFPCPVFHTRGFSASFRFPGGDGDSCGESPCAGSQLTRLGPSPWLQTVLPLRGCWLLAAILSMHHSSFSPLWHLSPSVNSREFQTPCPTLLFFQLPVHLDSVPKLSSQPSTPAFCNLLSWISFGTDLLKMYKFYTFYLICLK